MHIIFFSSDNNLIDEWIKRHEIKAYDVAYDCDSLLQIDRLDEAIVITDYDSVATELNKLITSNRVPTNVIVLERQPEIITGKMLISRSIKAYGNSRMLKLHYKQMINTVESGDIWTYPELTAALLKSAKKSQLSPEANDLIENRLTQKEKEIIYLVLEGLTNEAIAAQLAITQRTVKAHISSIFNKLHVNDRLSLVLLLK